MRSRRRADAAKKNLASCPRGRAARAVSAGMEHRTERSSKPGDPAGYTTDGVADAIRGLSNGDLVRLGALARLWSRGLPGGFG